MTEKEFDNYWRQNRNRILDGNEEYRKAKEDFKMRSGSDWILFGLPVVAGIVFMNNCHLRSELLTWIASAGVTVVCFAACVWVKSLITGSSSPGEIEARIRKELRDRLVD